VPLNLTGVGKLHEYNGVEGNIRHEKKIVRNPD